MTFQKEIDSSSKLFIFSCIATAKNSCESGRLPCETRDGAGIRGIWPLSFLFRYSYGQIASYHATEVEILTMRQSHNASISMRAANRVEVTLSALVEAIRGLPRHP